MIDTLTPLWVIAGGIVVLVALVCWATERERKDDDVQQYLDARRRHDLAGKDL